MATEPAFTAALQAPRQGRRYFTVAEANRALPYVRRVTDDVTATYRRAVALRQRLEQSYRGGDVADLRAQYEACMDRLNELVEELRLVGVDLKDFELGLVDFPARHEGREVCLCWKCGEASLQAWHEADAGYAGRQDLSLLHPH